MLALRRHKDRCRECMSPPVGISVDYRVCFLPIKEFRGKKNILDECEVFKS